MSLMNQVLQDLNNRKKSKKDPLHKEVPANLQIGALIKKRQSNLVKLSLLLAVLSVFTLIVLGIVVLLNVHSRPPTSVSHAIRAVTSPSKRAKLHSTPLNRTANEESRPKTLDHNNRRQQHTSVNTEEHQQLVHALVTSKAASSNPVEVAARSQGRPLAVNSTSVVADQSKSPLVVSPTAVKSTGMMSMPVADVKSQIAVSSISLNKRLQMALELKYQGHDNKAISLLNVPEVWQSTDIPALKTLVIFLSDANLFNKADSIINHALVEINSNNADLLFAKAYLLYKQQRYALALTVLSQHNPDLKQHIDYYALMAHLLLKQNRIAMAASMYRLIISQQPYNARWWLGLGMALQAQDQVDASREALSRAFGLGQLPATTMAYIQNQLLKTPYAPPV